MFTFTDTYTFRARVQPALVVALPLGFLLFALLPGHHFFVTAFFGLLGTAGGTAIFAQIGRDRGLKNQNQLWESWNGAPTTRLLRHRLSPGDNPISDTLRRRIEHWWGKPLPTKQEETEDPISADAIYREVTLDLIDATRDESKFPLVLAENTNYGFRRNLWGLKPWGLSLAIPCTVLAWTIFATTISGRPWPTPWWDILVNPDSTAMIRLAVSITNTAFTAFWLAKANPKWIKPVADTYANQLLNSARTLESIT